MRNTVLIVDDVDINREILTNILEEDYRIVTAKDGINAIESVEIEEDNLVAILLDLVMPNMDGFEVLEELNNKGILNNVPVLVISTEESRASEQECFSAGVSDFIHKPFDSNVVKTRVNNIVSLYLYKRHLEDTIEAQSKIIERRNSSLLDLLASVVESRDLESGSHVERVKGYTRILAEQISKKFPKYGLNILNIDILTDASALHDIGKISISDSILLKPSKLTPEEFEEMKKHTIKGAEFIKSARDMWDDDYGRISYEIARYHHEKYDGNGYPEGLKGNEIPISAQIVSIADCYDALVTKRCYKDAFAKEKAFDMIVNGECGAFNPDIMQCFIDRIDDFEQLADKMTA